MKILFVAMGYSFHAPRWVNQLSGLGWDLHLMPFSEAPPLVAEWRDVTVHDLWRDPGKLHASVRQRAWLRWPFPAGLTRFEQWSAVRFGGYLGRAARLARLIRRLRPDLVHVMEMQHGGYLMSQALDRIAQADLPPLIYSSWGSDLSFYGPRTDHEPRIRRFLSRCDYHFSDCQRDVELARTYGFRGETLAVVPGPGGFDVQESASFGQPGPTSSRRVIILKGYHEDTWAGRALVGLHALQLCAERLKGYELVIYSARENVRHAADFFSRTTGIPTTILKQSDRPTLLRAMGRARLSIGMSVSDGTPNTMLESMMVGAFPIQSDTGATGEWITDGVNGCLVPSEDAVATAAAIRRALDDDGLVDRAAELNLQMMREKVDRSVVMPKVIAAYERARRQGRRTAGV